MLDNVKLTGVGGNRAEAQQGVVRGENTRKGGKMIRREDVLVALSGLTQVVKL